MTDAAPVSTFKSRMLFRLLGVFARLRPASRLRLGRILGRLAYRLVRPRVRVARRNLEICFPEQTAEQREILLRQHFHALAQSVIDRGVLWRGSEVDILDMVELRGFEHIQALQDTGRPVIMLAPHFIGLDAAATRLSIALTEAASIYSVQSDPGIDALVRAGRARFNKIHLVSRRDGVRGLIRHLRAGLPVYYLPDMDFGRRGAIFTPFFGTPAATIPATAQIARNWHAAVVPIISTWDPASGRYLIEVLPALEDFPGDASLEEATARLNHLLEGWIMARPSQYYWVHRRFKTRPEGEPGLY
ncbi:MAG: lysophospholipid acyltransferase family protein [Corticimicrobacter sp.]|uniref:lysophospholipid acyltransferase family protein n=1 Tax=Corticimicrobacter sp. TaxID=2678536 RepID=UPI0032DBE46C